MPLFIVKGYYEVSHYGHEHESDRTDVMHPVIAEDDYEARNKFVHAYEKRTDPYSVYYSAVVEDVFETIE